MTDSSSSSHHRKNNNITTTTTTTASTPSSFRYSPSNSSYWTSFLFHFTIPSVIDVWRHLLDDRYNHHSSSSSSSSSNPPSWIYRLLRTIHRSFKLIYRITIWLLVRFGSSSSTSLQDVYGTRRSSELGRALQDASQETPSIRLRLPPTVYRDDEDESDHDHQASSDDHHPDDHHPAGSRMMITNSIVWRVDWIIRHSRRLETTKSAIDAAPNQDTDPNELAEAIVVIKRINPIFCSTLAECLQRIQAASRARHMIEERARMGYEGEVHQLRFKELFRLLKPGLEYDSLPPKAWQLIGFQGTDPSTDLRGAGILGLDALIVFARHFGPTAQALVTEAVEGGSSWYPWALASINVTWWCISLAKRRELDYFLLSPSPSSFLRGGGVGRRRTSPESPENERKNKTRTKSDEESSRMMMMMDDVPKELEDFLVVQIKLTYLFHRFWIDLPEPKPTVMEFEARFKTFKSLVHPGLSKGLIGGLGLGWILDPHDSREFPFLFHP